jgi:FkbM family methyltransferase
MRPIEEFNWGEWPNKEFAIEEIFEGKTYERFFEVEPGDVVLDIGASIGLFTYTILEKGAKHIYCVEPSESQFPILIKNTIGYPVTHILKGISKENGIIDQKIDYNMLFGGETQMEGITFSKLRYLYDLEKIDFLKIDCEGGEYDVFTEENLDFLKSIPKIAGEWHLQTPEEKSLFRFFRDNILPNFKNYNVLSVDFADIKWDLWNESFVEYYNQVMIYIDNR